MRLGDGGVPLPADADFSDNGMTREDRILARVVLDLGLAKPSDIEGAVGKIRESGASLARVLQEAGCLKPRFLAAVEKVVKSKLATTKASGTARPSARMRAQRPPSSRHPARPTTDAEKQQALPSLGTPQLPAEPGHPEVQTTPQAQGPAPQLPDPLPSERDPTARPKPPDARPLEADPPPSSQYMREREARRRRRANRWGRDGPPGTQ